MKRILILDDEKDVLVPMTKLLKSHAFSVTSISNPSELFEAVKNFKPHVLIMDIYLSGLDGRNICYRLKRNKETTSTKIILCSGYYNIANTYSDFEADDFIMKPFSIRDLVDKINHLTTFRANETGKKQFN
jgi:DNA-binding response OmpR family regulator